MFTRIAILFGIFTTMGLGGYVTGHMKMQHGHGPDGAPPHEHPLTTALELKSELQLSADQIARLEKLRDDMMKDLEPIHAKLRSIHERAATAHETKNQEAMAQLEEEMKALEATARPTLERYAAETIKMLSPEQHQKLGRRMSARMADHGARDFILMYVMEVRDQLGITPQQFTKLQYLQADFIRAFAPLREQLELLHLQAQQAPSAEIAQKAAPLQKQIKELQATFSHRALMEVLNPAQQEKVKQMLHGGSQSNPTNHGTRGSHGG